MIRPYRLKFKQDWAPFGRTKCGWWVQYGMGWGDHPFQYQPQYGDPVFADAQLDDQSRQLGLSLRHYLNRSAADQIKLNMMAGSPLHIHLPIQFKTVKLKIDDQIEASIEALFELHRLYPQVRWRLDINQKWTASQAQYYLTQLNTLPIDYIEEPIRSPRLDQLAELQQKTGLAIALDESWFELGSDWLKQNDLNILVLKPARLGIQASYQWGQAVLSKGKRLIISSYLESAIGLWANAQLAAALDENSDEYHGLATFQWWQQGPIPVLDSDCWRLNGSRGIGLQIDDLQL